MLEIKPSISKELFKEVIFIDPFSDIELSETNAGIEYIIKNYETEEDGEIVYIDFKSYIDIYRLTHECKEWANSKGYSIFSGRIIDNIIDDTYEAVIIENYGTPEYRFEGDTEPDAVFQACEWVYNTTKTI